MLWVQQLLRNQDVQTKTYFQRSLVAENLWECILFGLVYILPLNILMAGVKAVKNF